jgi:hypothetical protein
MSRVENITDAEFAVIVAECRALPPATGNYLIDDYIDNLFLTVLDFQLRTVTVERAMNHYKAHRKESIRTHQDLTQLLAQYSDTKEDNIRVAQYLWGYNYWNRVELLRRLVAYFEACGVSTQDELQKWAGQTDFEQFSGKIKGTGFAIYKWLVMRLGVETIKPDLWVHRFIQAAIGRKVSDVIAVSVLERAARDIGLRAYELDWRIWEYQRNLTP